MPTSTVEFLDLDFDNLSLDEVKTRLAEVGPETAYSYIVTPNVDHVVKLDRHPQLRSIYEDAGLCVCDSRILSLLARLHGKRLPVVPGSDLTEALFAEVIKPGDRVAIVGGDQHLITALRSRYAGVEFVHHIPPMGLSQNEAAQSAAAAFVASANARFTVLAVGSPQQEIIARRALSMNGAGGVALCVGASLDFLTGRQKRAPRVLRKVGLEWAHRLITNPRRLWRRYLVDGLQILPIFARHGRMLVASFALVALLIAGLAAGAIYGLNARDLAPGTGQQKVDAARLAAAATLRLPPPDLLRPLSPQEAAAVNAERPFVGRPDQAAASFRLNAAAVDSLRAETCLAQAVYYEAAGEGLDGQRAVAQVVLNRVRHPAYPSSVCGVVYQGSERATGCQFSFTCDGSLKREPRASGYSNARRIALEALSGRVFAPVGHATHFHANYVLPYWADSLDKAVQIGLHIFYRLRGTLGAPRIFNQRYRGSEPTIEANAETPLVIDSPNADQLVHELIADDISPDLRGGLPANKDLLVPVTPLEIDKIQSTLIADTNVQSPKKRPSLVKKKCGKIEDDRQLRPMTADSLVAGVDASC